MSRRIRIGKPGPSGSRPVMQGRSLLGRIEPLRDDGFVMAWVSGRRDEHATLEEARDNALKGPTGQH